LRISAAAWGLRFPTRPEITRLSRFPRFGSDAGITPSPQRSEPPVSSLDRIDADCSGSNPHPARKPGATPSSCSLYRLSPKGALQRAGVATTRALATLKDFRDGEAGDGTELVAAPGREALIGRLAATWPVGPRLDELVHRARRYRRWQQEPIRALSYIPSRGYGSLPYCAADHNPNLVRVYLDVQHDYLHDRLYLLSALVVACEGGAAVRRRSVVHLADGPPDGTVKISGWPGGRIGMRSAAHERAVAATQ